MPVSIWSTWALIKSVLEPLQTPESSEGREDDGENPSKGESENAKAEGIEEKTQEALKATVPSAHLFGEDEFPLLPLPPLPVLTSGEGPSFSRPQALMGRDFFTVKVKPHRSVCVQPRHITDNKAMTTTLERVLEGPVWGMSDQLLLFLRER